MNDDPTPARPRRFNPWPYVPVALIVLMLSGLGTMAKIAADDPSFAVEENYYQKAVAYEAEQAQREANRALAWELGVESRVDHGDVVLGLTVKDRHGRRLDDATVRVVAFPNDRASQIVRFDLAPGPEHRGRFPLSRRGLWELRFEVEHRGRRFTEVIRRDFGSGDSS